MGDRKQFHSNSAAFFYFSAIGGSDKGHSSPVVISPRDMRVGDELEVLGHRFLLSDCDTRTRKFYAEVLKAPQSDKLIFSTPEKRPQASASPVDALGFGVDEDLLASRKNTIKTLLNANKHLRYKCVLDSKFPFDQKRVFFLKYSLADDTISLTEQSTDNSGIQAGKFLSPQKVIHPDSDGKQHYSPKDLKIGKIYGKRKHLPGI